jgi:hypothetical protein
MTEADWLACDDPRPMLELLHGKVSERKLRLFLRACCRECWGASTDKATQLALECVEHLAESGGVKTMEAIVELSHGRAILDCSSSDPLRSMAVATKRGWHKQAPLSSLDLVLIRVIESLGCSESGLLDSHRVAWLISVLDRVGLSLKRQADLLRDIVRGSFRPLLFRGDWRTLNDGAARQIAQVIYEQQAFEHLPILADALQDAGCDSDEILDHLQTAVPHTRGCWVLDTVLAIG